MERKKKAYCNRDARVQIPIRVRDGTKLGWETAGKLEFGFAAVVVPFKQEIDDVVLFGLITDEVGDHISAAVWAGPVAGTVSGSWMPPCESSAVVRFRGRRHRYKEKRPGTRQYTT